MKKSLISILLIIAILLSSVIIYADEGNTLDAEKVAIKFLESSGMLKSANTALDNAADQLVAAQKMPSNYLNPLASEYQVNYVQRQRDLLQNSITYNAYSKYIEVLKAKYSVETQKQILEQAFNSYKSTELRAKLGQVSKEQLQISEGKYNAEQLLLQIEERDLQAIIASLNALMGESPTTQYTNFMDGNLIPAAEIASPEEYVSSAIANRAEILNTQEQLEIKILQRDKSFNPNGLKNNPDYIQIKQEIEIMNSQLDMSVVDVEIEILGLYDQLKSTMAALDSANDEMAEAEKNLKTAELKYKIGQISQIDIDGEELSYMKSKYNLKQAQLDAWLMQTRMNLASGLGMQRDEES